MLLSVGVLLYRTPSITYSSGHEGELLNLIKPLNLLQIHRKWAQKDMIKNMKGYKSWLWETSKREPNFFFNNNQKRWREQKEIVIYVSMPQA